MHAAPSLHHTPCFGEQDLVSRHLEYAANAADSIEDTGILLLGDSADRNLIFDFCSAAGHEVRALAMNLPQLHHPFVTFSGGKCLLCI